MNSHAPGEGGKNAPVQITEGPLIAARGHHRSDLCSISRGNLDRRRVVCSFSCPHVPCGHPVTGEQPKLLYMIGKFGYGGSKHNNGMLHPLCIFSR